MTLLQDDLAHIDVASPKVYAQGVPHETLDALRRRDPVHWHPCFDVGRQPNPHTTFGRGGPHFCIGSFLARLEIGILLEEILARDVRFELAGPPVRLSSNFVNGFKSLPVRVLAGALRP